MVEQLAFDGIEPGPPKKRRSKKVFTPKKGGNWRRTSYGVEVPVPVDDLGQELAMGPHRVLQTVNGGFFVIDYRRELGRGTVFVGGFDRQGKIDSIVWMVAQSKSSTGPT